MNSKEILVKVLEYLLSQKSKQLKDVRKILIIKQHDQIGDLIQILPTIKSLNDNFPDAEFYLLARPYTKDIMHENPLFKEVLAFHTHPCKWGSNSFLFRKRFDVGIVMNTVSHSLTSDILACLLCKVTIGADHPLIRGSRTSFLYNIKTEAIEKGQQWEKYSSVLKAFNLETPVWLPLLEISDEEKKKGASIIKEVADCENPVAIHPLHRDIRRRWAISLFARLIISIEMKTGNKPLIVWGPKEEALRDRLQTHLHGRGNFIPKTNIRELMGILFNSSCLIGTDTATYHIASALGKPTLTLYGDVSPDEWLPPSGKSFAIESPEGNIRKLGYEKVEKEVFSFLDFISTNNPCPA
ncbi:MAG: glycosyltransferase family 9 protein [Candidatus Coatesbacteria bacterium]|nr:glycosyltransferase family 9 protein [Candidatus Coatesbacteria bacterium]